jgi:broad specificity phosphatase PhoE
MIDTRQIQIVRHGATKLNSDDNSVDRIRGWRDIPLSDEGKEQAKRLGYAMLNDRPDVIVTSDLCRAHETAKMISDIIDVPIEEVSEKFRPWNVGDYAGMLSAKAIPILARYACDTPDKPMPGGESFNDFHKRFFDGLNETLQQQSGRVAVVTHHRNERLLHAWAKKGFPTDGGIDLKEFNKKGEHTGSVTSLDIPADSLRTAA